MRNRTLYLALIVLSVLAPATRALGAPPASAFVEGVENVGWGVGNCMVASFGQLVQQRDASIAPAEVVVRAGVCTQAALFQAGSTRVIVDHPRFINMGKRVDAARLFGLGYEVAWMKSRARPYGIARQADSLTTFASIEDAVTRLKELIAAGTPVQVHVDTAWLHRYGGQHGSHFVVVHAYDENNVYYCENGGLDGSDENLPLLWADFIQAWTRIAFLNPQFPGQQCFMLYLTADPVRVDDDWILAWLAQDVAASSTARVPAGPAAIRAAAALIRHGADGNVVFDVWMRGIWGNWKPYMVEFLTLSGHNALAAEYQAACDIWTDIHEMPNPDWNVVVDMMDDAADIEESVLEQMAALAAGLDSIQLFAPAGDAHINTLEACAFRWAQLPGVTRAVLQLAMTENFDDKRATRPFRPRPFQWFVRTGSREWLSVLRLDGGNRSLAWRVAGVGRDAAHVSAEHALTWDEIRLTSLSPADDYAMADDEVVTFAFEAPFPTQRPRVVVCTEGSFVNPRTRLYLAAARGSSEVSFRANTLRALRSKDDGDGAVFWRVEDAAARVTTAEPSGARTLWLP